MQKNIKKLLIFSIPIVLSLGLFSFALICASKTDIAIEIASVVDLEKIEKNPSGRFRLTDDINLKDFKTICCEDNPFTGYLDGNNHSFIYPSYISSKTSNNEICSFIGVNKGTIIHCNFWNSSKTYNFESSDNVVFGGVCGINYGKVTSCKFTASSITLRVACKSIFAGSACGINYGDIRNCVFSNLLQVEGTVENDAYIGGLCGRMEDLEDIASIIEYTMRTNTLSVNIDGCSKAYIGGFSGHSIGGTIKDSYGSINLKAKLPNYSNDTVSGYVGLCEKQGINIFDCYLIPYFDCIDGLFNISGISNGMVQGCKDVLIGGKNSYINNDNGGLNLFIAEGQTMNNCFYSSFPIETKFVNYGGKLTVLSEVSRELMNWTSNVWKIANGRIYFRDYECN